MQARITGLPSREKSIEKLKLIRQCWGNQLPIIASGGICEPEDALRMLDAGATFVQLHSGMVFSGPGLPKRINEAVAYYQRTETEEQAPPPSASLSFLPGWMWAALLGVGMIISGILAWMVAVTEVVLPYDLTFLGMSRSELAAINDRLLPFMSHDRISLAGTMISIGILYLQLALFPLRHGVKWARKAYIASGTIGFTSIFLFIGFGYVDILHALLSSMLIPLFLLSLKRTGPAEKKRSLYPPNLVGNERWRRALFGQLLFVMIGFGLTGAGLVISAIGITHVFVPQDLSFMGTEANMLHAANHRLIPLIAHDRAGFGGALVSDGLAVLLLSLWGFRQGERWLWWTLLAAGLPGFIAGIGIHFAVDYTDFWHLFPAYVGAGCFVGGLVLSRPYLWKKAHPYTP